MSAYLALYNSTLFVLCAFLCYFLDHYGKKCKKLQNIVLFFKQILGPSMWFTRNFFTSVLSDVHEVYIMWTKKISLNDFQIFINSVIQNGILLSSVVK